MDPSYSSGSIFVFDTIFQSVPMPSTTRTVLTFRSVFLVPTVSFSFVLKLFYKIKISGGGDMDAFPVLEFNAPDLNQDAIDGERTIDIEVSL